MMQLLFLLRWKVGPSFSVSIYCEAQQYLNVWFQNYFPKFSDCTPNRLEIYYLIVTSKSSIRGRVHSPGKNCRSRECLLKYLSGNIFLRLSIDRGAIFQVEILFYVLYHRYLTISFVVLFIHQRYLRHLLWNRYSTSIQSWRRNSGTA